MSNDIYIGIMNRSEHALRLLFGGKVEVAMNGGDHEVELGQDLVSKVECAITQDITFAAFEDVQATRELLIEAIDLNPLLLQALFGQAVSIGCYLAMIGNTQIFKATRYTAFSHLTNSILSIAPGRVSMDHASQIAFLNECRQSMLDSSLDLTHILTQLWFDVLHAQRGVDLAFV